MQSDAIRDGLLLAPPFHLMRDAIRDPIRDGLILLAPPLHLLRRRGLALVGERHGRWTHQGLL